MEVEPVTQLRVSVLVLDTNFVLDQLEMVRELAMLATEYHHLIIIPREVIHELDGLKNGVRNVASRARAASAWVFKMQAASSPAIRGQKFSEYVEGNLHGDDSIVDCCRYFAQNHLTVLLSNDKNICSKVLPNGILTITYVDGLSAQEIGLRVAIEAGWLGPEALNTLNTPHIEPHASKGTEECDIVDDYYHRKSSMNRDVEMDLDMGDMGDENAMVMPQPVNELPPPPPMTAGQLENYVHRVLLTNVSNLVDFRVRQVHDRELLAHIQYHKLPPVAAEIGKFIQKHDIDVFNDYLPRELTKKLTSSGRPASADRRTLEDFIDLWGAVIKRLSENKGWFLALIRAVTQVADDYYSPPRR